MIAGLKNGQWTVMKKLFLIIILGILSVTTVLVVVRQRSQPQVATPAPRHELLSFSRAAQSLHKPSASARPTVPVRTDAGHTLLVNQAMEQAPAWAILYGQEFWRKELAPSESPPNTSGAVPANIDLGNVIERVSSAITLASGADLPQAHSRFYAATFDGEGFRLSPHRFAGHHYEPASAADDFESNGTRQPLKARSIFEPDPSTELQFKTASIRLGDSELYADQGEARTWSILGNTAQRLLNHELGVVEHYETRREGVEVSWIISQRPSALGNLEIEAELKGLTLLYEDEAGIHFADRESAPRILVGQCTVADHTGKQFQVPMLAEASKLRAIIPEPMLAQMAFPLAIDPLIGPETGMGLPMAPNAQIAPSAASNGTNYLIAWKDCRLNPPNNCSPGNIYGTRISSAGKVLDPTGIVINGDSNGQTQPKVASNGSDFLVAWFDVTNAVGGATWLNVACTWVRADGVVLDTNGIQVTSTNAFRDKLDIACNGTNYLAVWEHETIGSSDPDIYGARLSSTNTALDFEGLSSTIRQLPGQVFPRRRFQRWRATRPTFL
jgi:hypothetical protein